MSAKKLIPLILSAISISANAYDYSSYSAAYSNSDYREAINMGLKFFGGQRCGDSHNWMLVNNSELQKNNEVSCHTQDGKGSVNGGGNGSYDLTGGWHDCGDHIKVGTTMGYAAVSLLIAYDVWPEAFQDNYDEAYGSSNNIPDVLDEVKYATDYFIKCFPNDNTFVYYVGFDGDHNVWMTSARQSKEKVANGGDPRPVWTASDKGGPQAANYASALALMSLHYPDADYKELCKTYAIKAYNFAKRNKSAHATIPTFYDSPNPEWTDELALAAILLYKLTGESQYKTEALNYLSGKWESNSPLAWDTVSDFAYYYIAKDNSNANNGQGGYYASFLEKNVYRLHLQDPEEPTSDGSECTSNGFPYYRSKWGSNKLALGGAVAAALYVKLVEDGDVNTTKNINKAKNFTYRIVDYVLGKNEFNHTFLHGFKGDMTHKIHHRNAMGRNDNPPTETKNSAEYMFASGGLIGGPSGYGQFSNIIEGGNGFQETEGGCDYNAPFVAAIASIVAEKDPVSVNLNDAEATLTENSYIVYPTYFEDYIIVDMIERAYNRSASVQLYSIDGQLIQTIDITNKISTIIETSSLPTGFYIVKISADNDSVFYKVAKK
ncbi:MAG: glycoside hydrolase family 9 protein [Paludibacteraceae bacterium]|nr:glycoside hydrolase family 9 protein [Paludibacteraceae bacterium]